jgi:hypothetical protein
MIDYFLSRCDREPEYEEWNYYFSERGEIRVNKVAIFFHHEITNIYLLATAKEDMENTEYLNEVINLVHDLPTDFKLILEYFKPEEYNDEEYTIGEYFHDKVIELKQKEFELVQKPHL